MLQIFSFPVHCQTDLLLPEHRSARQDESNNILCFALELNIKKETIGTIGDYRLGIITKKGEYDLYDQVKGCRARSRPNSQLSNCCPSPRLYTI